MKIKHGFVLRTVGSEKIVVGEGLEHINFSRIVCLNHVAVYLWERIDGREFDVEILADWLTEKYDIDRHTALADCRQLIDVWREADILA